jgi:hypothetical protein
LPSRQQIHQLLTTAIDHGVRIFDTAHAYGSSEALVGEFFRRLSPATRQHLQVATKCGEHWNNDSQSNVVDHSYDALVWPMREGDHSYQVCLGCGIKRLFDEKKFRGYGPYGYDVKELIAREQAARRGSCAKLPEGCERN